jgi:energy-coupling factor transporter transmembrane protein EcfT
MDWSKPYARTVGIMERLIVAFVMLGTGLILPAIVRLPASVLACSMVILFYRVRFHKILLRFLIIWLCFYICVGTGRYFAGTELRSLIVDGAASLGLAIGISCSLLLVATDIPSKILHGLDRIKIPRDISYALLSLLRLLPRVRTLGSRQLMLLQLKGISGGSLVQRFHAYRRILGPLLVILLTQQFTHARGLELRGFFESQTYYIHEETILGLRGIIIATLLILNAAFWYGVSLWK